MRRLPVWLLADVSGSMRGEGIAATNAGLRMLVSALRQDPYALETIDVSLLVFAREPRLLVPLTPLANLMLPELPAPEDGPSHLGLALEEVGAQVRRRMRSAPEDWAPCLIVATDGRLSDKRIFSVAADRIRAFGFARVAGCLAGPNAESRTLARFCDLVTPLDELNDASCLNLAAWREPPPREAEKIF